MIIIARSFQIHAMVDYCALFLGQNCGVHNAETIIVVGPVKSENSM